MVMLECDCIGAACCGRGAADSGRESRAVGRGIPATFQVSGSEHSIIVCLSFG